MERRLWCVSVAVLWSLAAGVPRKEPGELRLFAPASYDVESTVLINDAARKDKEVGYKIVAGLDVAPLWAHQHSEALLRFQLHNPKLYLRGKHVNADFLPHDSVLDSHTHSTFYAHWKNGLIQTTYLDPEETLDVVNYKKSLASLFQFQILDGEYNETDVSGPCSVLYETVSINVFRKIKRSCSEDASSAVAGARRVARYTLSAALDAVDALYADELLTLGDAALGLKARAWHRLARRAAAPPAPPAAAALPDALRALPAALRPQPLALAAAAAAGADEELSDEELIGALEEMSATLESDTEHTAQGEDGGERAGQVRDEGNVRGAGAEGEEEADAGGAAAALLRALPTLRAAPAARLSALLQRDDVHPHLTTAVRALGLAGTRAAHAAVDELVQLSAREPLLPLALTYLQALALAVRPDEWVVLEALRLGDEARAPAVAESAGRAAAAAAARLADASGAADALAQTVRDSLAKSLTRCKDEKCRAVRLQALGNLRRADTADLLLEHAARGAEAGEPAAALAALDALGAAPPRALTFARLDRLAQLALDERAPLEVRAAALDLGAVRRAALPAPEEALARAAGALHASGGAAHELRRVLWQRLAALAERHAAVRRLPSVLPPLLRGWDAQAHDGTSMVLERSTGWSGGGWEALLEAVTVARRGLMRRATVTLRARGGSDGDARDLLTVAVWTRGLEAFGGAGDAPADDAPEEAAGGLALSVGGARTADVTLFDGQAELLGHVWAGTASSPTPVLRALHPLADARADVPLLAGVRLRVRSAAALALALDAQAQVSLWYRSARSELELRAGAASDVTASLRTAWGSVNAAAAARAAPRLRIGADLDFYSGVALCVRARTDAFERRRRVALREEQGARRFRVWRVRRERWGVGGRTLALGRPNDATCRTLRAADDA